MFRFFLSSCFYSRPCLVSIAAVLVNHSLVHFFDSTTEPVSISSTLYSFAEKTSEMFSIRQIAALALALSSASAACVPRGSSGSETTPTSAAPTTVSSLVASNLPVQAVSASASSSAASVPTATASSSSSASGDGTKYLAVL